MKKYYVSIPFEGSLTVCVEANSEDEALEIGQNRIEAMSCEEISQSAEFGRYEVYEA